MDTSALTLNGDGGGGGGGNYKSMTPTMITNGNHDGLGSPFQHQQFQFSSTQSFQNVGQTY